MILDNINKHRSYCNVWNEHESLKNTIASASSSVWRGAAPGFIEPVDEGTLRHTFLRIRPKSLPLVYETSIEKASFFKEWKLKLRWFFLGGMWSLNHVKSSLNISLNLQSRYSHLSSSFPTKMWPVVPNREEESKRRSTNWLHLAPIELKAPCMIRRHWWCDEGQDDRTNHWIVV